jgi:hypothetical protein
MPCCWPSEVLRPRRRHLPEHPDSTCRPTPGAAARRAVSRCERSLIPSKSVSAHSTSISNITKDRQPLVWHEPIIEPQQCADTGPVSTGDPPYPYVGKLVHDLTLAQIRTPDCGKPNSQLPCRVTPAAVSALTIIAPPPQRTHRDDRSDTPAKTSGHGQEIGRRPRWADRKLDTRVGGFVSSAKGG